jgi:hypothetical protein
VLIEFGAKVDQQYGEGFVAGESLEYVPARPSLPCALSDRYAFRPSVSLHTISAHAYCMVSPHSQRVVRCTLHAQHH